MSSPMFGFNRKQFVCLWSKKDDYIGIGKGHLQPLFKQGMAKYSDMPCHAMFFVLERQRFIGNIQLLL